MKGSVLRFRLGGEGNDETPTGEGTRRDPTGSDSDRGGIASSPAGKRVVSAAIPPTILSNGPKISQN